VASEEVQASLARSQGARLSTGIAFEPVFMTTELQEAYPLLLAAVMPHEDILMTCARALDEATDVSLVREAAAYLEQVELQRHTTR
jgi:A1 cistron-splicing factor AAR2